MANDEQKEQGLKRLACDVFGHTWKLKPTKRGLVEICSTCGVKDRK